MSNAAKTAGRRESIISPIPRIAASSLSTAEYRWRFTDAWNDEDLRAFVGLAQGPTSGFFRPLPFESGRKRAAGQLAGRWLLSFERPGAGSGPPVLMVEAQAYFRQFRVLEVVVSAGAGSLPERGSAPLSLMISALIILSKCDVLRLIGGTEALSQDLAGLGWGEVRNAWSPRDLFLAAVEAAGPVGESRALVSVDPSAWWLSDHGAADKQTLSYLEKRMDMAEKLKPGRKPRRSVFERISKLMRWS